MRQLPRRHQGLSASRQNRARSTARPATPIRPLSSRAACTQTARSIPAPAATATRTTSIPKTDARSAVYPLNVPKTCGTVPRQQRHGRQAWPAQRLPATTWIRFTASRSAKKALLVAANCQSCHGSHNILSHTNPQSPTYKANIPKTCGTCHAKIDGRLRARRSRQSRSPAAK